MASRKITEYTALTTPANNDVLPIIDVSEPIAADQNKKITIPNLTSQLSAASTSAAGIVQLSDSTSSTSTSLAATANAVKTTYDLANGKATLTLDTAKNSTSGTFVDFTGLPTGIKRITVMFNGVSTSGTSPVLIQLGTSSGVVATGYTASGIGFAGTGSSSAASSTGFQIENGASVSVASSTRSGATRLHNVSGNVWVAEGTYGNGSAIASIHGGAISLAATLDQVRITTVNGTDTFDAGSINILYEI